jgi:hypothetical protein
MLLEFLGRNGQGEGIIRFLDWRGTGEDIGKTRQWQVGGYKAHKLYWKLMYSVGLTLLVLALCNFLPV